MSIKENIEECGFVEKEISPIEIDLGMVRKGQLNETSFGQFGDKIELILRAMFEGGLPSGFVRGTEREIGFFTNLLKSERNYISAYQKYGLDNTETYSSKYKLDKAIQGFEKETGIKWPIK